MSKLYVCVIICFTVFFLISCNSRDVDKHGSTKNYIDTKEEFQKFAPDFNRRKDAIHKLSKEQRNDSLTNFTCEILAQMNLDLYMKDNEAIVEGFFDKDSIQYRILLDIFTPVSYLFVGNANRQYTRTELSAIKRAMEEKCPDIFIKYENMEGKHMDVLMGLMSRVGK